MKYIIKFKKEGKIKFISHLDLQKVFLRLFRIIDLKPKYSNGFNPHPKLSFALPLSLGFSSESEYMEIEAEEGETLNEDQVTKAIKPYIPEGLTIVYVKEKPESLNKKLASYVQCAEYEIVAPIPNGCDIDSKSVVDNFLNKKDINYIKTSRKTGKSKEINIRPMIFKLKISVVNNNNISLSCLLEAGNNSVLNPNVLVEKLYDFMDISIDINQVSIRRTATIIQVDEKLTDVDNIFNSM